MWRPKKTGFARKLRRDMTDAERRLWHALRNRRISEAKFRRQVPVGPYIADFLCVAARLVIEVDGGQHVEDGPRRTSYLESQGYRVIRFWNNEVLANLDGALERIVEELENK